jgi:hypothetical protein
MVDLNKGGSILLFKLYYKVMLWKAKKDYDYYTEITGQPNERKQQEMDKYINKLNSLETSKDPVKHCDYYKKNGCVHVDGFLCPCEEMEQEKELKK